MNYRIRKVDSNGIMTTWAGCGSPGFNGDSIPATAATITTHALAFDSIGNGYFPDANERIRKIDTNGIITTIGGIGIGGYNGDSIPATDAMLEIGGNGIAIDKYGSIVFGDEGNDRIRKIDALSGYIFTIAGTGVTGYNGDEIPATSAQIFFADGMVFDTAWNLIFSDALNNRIRKINRVSGIITTIVGNGGSGGFGGDEGLATAAALDYPGGLVFDKNNNLIFCDVGNQRVRIVDATDDLVHTLAGNGVVGYNGEGILATAAELASPDYPAINTDGYLLFSDFNNSRIRIVNGTVGVQNVLASRKNFAIRISPNPASTYITLTPATGQWQPGTTIDICDIRGRCLSNINNPTGTLTVSTTQWDDGLYFLKIHEPSGTSFSKLVIKH